MSDDKNDDMRCCVEESKADLPQWTRSVPAVKRAPSSPEYQAWLNKREEIAARADARAASRSDHLTQSVLMGTAAGAVGAAGGVFVVFKRVSPWWRKQNPSLATFTVFCFSFMPFMLVSNLARGRLQRAARLREG